MHRPFRIPLVAVVVLTICLIASAQDKKNDKKSPMTTAQRQALLKTFNEEFVSIIQPVMELAAGVRRFGSTALDLAYVAAGRYEGFWEFGLAPWNVAAGIIIVREAGGMLSEIGGGTNILRGGSIVATNDLLHAPMQRLIRDTTHSAQLA